MNEQEFSTMNTKCPICDKKLEDGMPITLFFNILKGISVWACEGKCAKEYEAQLKDKKLI